MEKLLHNKQKYSYYEYQSEGQFGGMYSTSSIQKIFLKALKNSKIHKKATGHTLRHSYATHFLESGKD